MQDILNSVVEFLKTQMLTMSPFLAIFLGMAIIIVESILPVLPLAVFIAINMLVFGGFLGFMISWSATVIGCILSFTLFRKGLNKFFYKNVIDDKEKIKKFMHTIKKMPFSNLVVIIALPFTPAFLVNIAAGLSKMSYRKFTAAIVIGKLAVVYFWGFVGKTFVTSVTDFKVLFELGIVLLLAYGVSKFVTKEFGIK